VTAPVRRAPRPAHLRRLLASSAVRGLVAGLALAALIASCVVNRLVGPRLTGTCEGACSHYVACKNGKADRGRCLSECPDVFADRDSLMAFESLSCPNAVEYVDGSQRQVANPL
jgi:hypothetical protein